MVAGGTGDNAFCAFLLGQLADFVVSTAHLKAAGQLKILGLQIEITVTVQPGRCNQIRFARYVPQHKGRVIDLIQCEHNRPPYSLFRKENSGHAYARSRRQCFPVEVMVLIIVENL